MIYNSNFQVKANTFSTLSMSMGIISICGIIILGPFTFPFSGLAIIFAILSKEGDTTYPPRSKIGLITGTIGFVFITSIMILILYLLISSPEFFDEFSSIYQQMYGETLDGIGFIPQE